MSDAPRKARRRWIAIPYILVALAAVGWSFFWFASRDKIELGLDRQAQALRATGYQVVWASRTVTGFPFRYYVTFKDAKIAEPGGFGLAAAFLEAEAAAYSPSVVVISAPQGVTLTRPDGRAYGINGDVLRMSVGGYRKSPPRISIEGVKLAIAPVGGGPAPALAAINRLEARIKPIDGDRAQLFLRIDQASVGGDDLLARIASGKPVTVGIEGTLTKASALHGANWPELVRGWGASGGGLDVVQGGIEAGEAMLSLRPSRIAPDPDGHIRGKLKLSLTRASDAMLAAGAIGALPRETAAVASGLAAIQGGSGGEIQASLSFHDGKAWLGPLPLGDAPRVF